MTEQAGQEPNPQEDQQQEDQAPPPPPPGQAETFDKAYVEQLRREAAKYRSEAKKANDQADKLAKERMSEAERAIAEARKEGETAAQKLFGARLVRSELKAAAATKGVPLDELLEDLDLTRYIGEDGEPDSKRIEATVNRFAALAAPKNAQSFDGGSRQPPKAQNMNDVIRRQAGYQT